MEKQESSEESTKITVISQRKCIKHFSEVQSYIPGSTLQYDYDRIQVLKRKLQALNIGVFGGIASGKSCFVNTVESVFSGEYSDHAGENRLAKEGDKCIGQATTAERIKVRVGQKICLVDNRGFPKKCNEEIAQEVVKQCGKWRPHFNGRCKRNERLHTFRILAYVIEKLLNKYVQNALSYKRELERYLQPKI